MPTAALFWIPVHLRLCVGWVRGASTAGAEREGGGLVKKRERYFTSYL